MDKEELELSRSLEMLKMNIEIWKTIIDTQKHFNDLEMKVRNFGILILSAFIGAIGVSLKSGYTIDIIDLDLPIGSILALGAAFTWFLFYIVDAHWYHPLLIGAVKKGIEIERELKEQFPHINLTQKIGEESPQDILWFKNVHSAGKAKIFYFGVLFVLLSTCIALSFSHSLSKTSNHTGQSDEQKKIIQQIPQAENASEQISAKIANPIQSSKPNASPPLEKP